MDALVPNPGVGIKTFASYTPNVYTLKHIDTFAAMEILSLAKADVIEINPPSGLVDIPPETTDGEIPAVLMRDLCSSGDSVIGFIKGALDGPFFFVCSRLLIGVTNRICWGEVFLWIAWNSRGPRIT